MSTTTVYASRRGARYHGTRNCRAHQAGQLLNDWDTPDDAYLSSWAFPTMHGIEALTATEALGQGKTPCLVCLPASGAGLAMSSCEDDFGHQPVIGLVDGRGLGPVCARCYTTRHGAYLDAFETPRRYTARESVRWPCTSAIVLGLAPRPES